MQLGEFHHAYQTPQAKMMSGQFTDEPDIEWSLLVKSTRQVLSVLAEDKAEVLDQLAGRYSEVANFQQTTNKSSAVALRDHPAVPGFLPTSEM